MGVSLPRLPQRPEGVVTRRELAAALGYSETSMAMTLARHPEWPGPVALVQHPVHRQWVLVYDLAAMLEAVPAATAVTRAGARPRVSEPDGVVVCLECGRRLRALGRHLQAAHDLTAQEYRDRHRLPSTAALMADGVRERQSERMRDEDTSHLAQWQTRDHLDSIRDTAAQKATADFELVRAHRLPGRQRAAKVMQERRRQILEDKVRAHGYDGLDDGIRRTMHLTTYAAAEALGIGPNTVTRHRRRGAAG